jgi:hypothetical protein
MVGAHEKIKRCDVIRLSLYWSVVERYRVRLMSCKYLQLRCVQSELIVVPFLSLLLYERRKIICGNNYYHKENRSVNFPHSSTKLPSVYNNVSVTVELLVNK